ncbi:MAG: CotH kinase family protein [Balneola sp.]
MVQRKSKNIKLMGSRTLLKCTLILVSFITFSCNTNNDKGDAIPADLIPVFNLDTFGNPIPGNPKINAQLSISIDSETSFEGKIAIESRGSSSQNFPKKSYSFETRDANNQDVDVALLGLPEEEDWVLIGPYSDKTLIRNIFIYDLFKEMGNYSSRSVLVELNLNDEHQGVYLLSEKLKRDNNRIDISKLNPDENSGEDLTGGYILQIDRDDEEKLNDSFTSNYQPPFAQRGQQVTFVYEEPGADEITDQQKNYIQNYIFGFEDALASQDFTDPVTGYLSYINVSSFIDFFLINELANNVDAYRLSTYLTKDKNGKLNMGPVWDFNYSLGNVDYCSAGETNVWAYTFNERCGDHDQQVPFWWSRLLEDPAFVVQLKDRWSKLRNDEFSLNSLNLMIDNYSTLLKETGAAERNFMTWDILGTDVHPNSFVGETYDNEINYLKDWISDRLNWMDGAIDAL